MIGVGVSIGNIATRTRGVWTPLSLGPALLAWWDASTGINLSSNQVTSWVDRKAGHTVAQGSSPLRPTWSGSGFAGAPGLNFDGSDDYLELAGQPFPTGAASFEVWSVSQQSALVADTGSKGLVCFGGDTNLTQLRHQRQVSVGVNRAGNQTGTGTSVIGAAAPSADFSGRHLVRTRNTPTAIYVSIDGGAEGVAAGIPAVGGSRVRIGAFANSSPSNYWLGLIRDIVITTSLSSPEASKLHSYLSTRINN